MNCVNVSSLTFASLDNHESNIILFHKYVLNITISSFMKATSNVWNKWLIIIASLCPCRSSLLVYSKMFLYLNSVQCTELPIIVKIKY